jgi:biopolymer transport protein TolR
VAKHRSKGAVSADINVTPMADIMLVLLIIFMLTIPHMQSSITVNLPKAKNPLDAPNAEKKESVIIAINREGRLYYRQTQVTENELYKFLEKRYAEGEADKTIYLKADNAISYGRVVTIVDGCRKAGVDRIGLMAEKEK